MEKARSPKRTSCKETEKDMQVIQGKQHERTIKNKRQEMKNGRKKELCLFEPCFNKTHHDETVITGQNEKNAMNI